VLAVVPATVEHSRLVWRRFRRFSKQLDEMDEPGDSTVPARKSYPAN